MLLPLLGQISQFHGHICHVGHLPCHYQGPSCCPPASKDSCISTCCLMAGRACNTNSAVLHSGFVSHNNMEVLTDAHHIMFCGHQPLLRVLLLLLETLHSLLQPCSFVSSMVDDRQEHPCHHPADFQWARGTRDSFVSNI